MKCLNSKLYYQQLHFKYLCNLARYWLQPPWGWHDSVETCRSVIICEVIVHLLVTVQNNKRCTVQVLKFKKKEVHLHFLTCCDLCWLSSGKNHEKQGYTVHMMQNYIVFWLFNCHDLGILEVMCGATWHFDRILGVTPMTSKNSES